MAISTGTYTIKQSNLINNEYILSILLACTGDGSGGSVYVTQDIGSFVPSGAFVSVLDAGESNDDNVARTFDISLALTDWTHIISGTLIAYNANSVLTAGSASMFTSSINSALSQFPIALGEKLTATPTIYYTHQTNTNGKHYYFWIKLLVKIK